MTAEMPALCQLSLKVGTDPAKQLDASAGRGRSRLLPERSTSLSPSL